MKPVKDRVLIKPDNPDSLDDLLAGKVVAVGEEVKEISKGDRVLYNRYALFPFKNYHIVNENQIILKHEKK